MTYFPSVISTCATTTHAMMRSESRIITCHLGLSNDISTYESNAATRAATVDGVEFRLRHGHADANDVKAHIVTFL